MSFKIGDKVQTKVSGWTCPSLTVGTVVSNEGSSVGVLFIDWYGGHSLGEILMGSSRRSGWWLPARALTLVRSVDKTTVGSVEDSPLIKKIKYLEHKFKTRHDPIEKKQEEWYDF